MCNKFGRNFCTDQLQEEDNTTVSTMSVDELLDEVSAIEAIYPDSVQKEAPQIYTFTIPNHKLIKLQINFPTSYPDESPELLMLVNKDNLKYTDTTYLEKIVNSAIYNTFVSGQVLMYELLTQLLELLDGYLEERVRVNEEEPATEEQEKTPPPQTQPPVSEIEEVKDVTADWVKSDVISDRRSSFIAYARVVESLEEALMHIEELLQDKRVSKAAHNISSWRINTKENKRYQDCDDDGETAAGGRLLHLLQVCINSLHCVINY